MSFAKMPVLRRGLMVLHEDIFTEEARNLRVERLRALTGSLGLDGAILYSSPSTSAAVCHMTNYPCYGAGRQTAFFLGKNGDPLLFTSDPGRNIPKVRKFIFYDIQKGRKFMTEAAKAANALFPEGKFGVVGYSYMPAEAQAELEAVINPDRLTDIEDAFFADIAVVDSAALAAAKRANLLAGKALALLEDELRERKKTLWQIAADIDREMRYLGCEATNLLFGSGSGALRPGLPEERIPAEGEAVAAYVAVQYARHWGAVGRGFGVKNGEKLEAIRTIFLAANLDGLTVADCRKLLDSLAAAEGVTLAKDLTAVKGLGLDPAPYPVRDEHWVREGMLLELVLAAEGARAAFASDMILVGKGGNRLLADA